VLTRGVMQSVLKHRTHSGHHYFIPALGVNDNTEAHVENVPETDTVMSLNQIRKTDATVKYLRKTDIYFRHFNWFMCHEHVLTKITTLHGLSMERSS